MKMPSLRAHQIAPSLTVAIDTLAKQMIQAGEDIVALGAGEPDFDTPDFIKNAGIQSINDNKTRYTAPDGILPLKEAICRKLSRENSLVYSPNQIVVTSGAKHAVLESLMAIIDPGDEVIIPSPYWVTYPELVRFLGGIPIIVDTNVESGFLMQAEQLQSAISPRTKALILNSPNNPSGAMYSTQSLKSFANILLAQGIFCISDEIYEHMSYNEKHSSIANTSSAMQERTILINGVSKSYAMTGWRIGYIAASTEMAGLIAKIQGQATHHPANVSQWAAVSALENGQDFYKSMRDSFLTRRNQVIERIQKIPGVQIQTPPGAFYVFPTVNSYYGKKSSDGILISDSITLCKWLLEKHRLAIVPGAAFGMDSCIRLSYAASPSILEKALDRLETGLQELWNCA